MGKNRRTTTAKERMFKKIRQALLQKREHPYPQFEDSNLYQEDNNMDLPLLFAEQFTAVSGQFVYCEDTIQLIENLIILVEQKKLRKIYAFENNVQELLSTFEFPYIFTDVGFNEAEIGITGCEALIARNGSIMISNASASGRRLSTYPPIHIVIATSSQLVMDIKDALDLMQKRYGQELPSFISIITGPSRTADIEKTLVLGAHGPKELYVFLLDN